MLAYVNGALVPEDEATISVFNAGFNFADGVFEGIRVYGGRVFRLDEHLERLAASAATFELDLGMSVGALRSEVLRWLAANGVDSDFHFRPIVTRADRHPPRMDPRFSSGDPTVVIVGGAVSQPPAGVAAVLSSKMLGTTSAGVLADFEKNVLPGFIVVPAGVAAVQQAQEHGWKPFPII